MAKKTMNCFVASAFDHPDIDAVYDQAVRPVLKELKIHSLRVDRVEHNDDIDDRIFQLIDKAQICIADLTHARPSVYYEAGYAFGRGKPVIYIARSDHLRPREDDPSGNLRVHFDLQMKNIIPWTTPNDAFRQRLRARLRHVTRPILRKNEADDAEERQAQAFAALSIAQQLESLRTKAINLLRVRGYSRHRFEHQSDLERDRYHIHQEKWSGQTCRQVHLVLTPTLNKTTVSAMRYVWWPMLTKEDFEAASRIESAPIFVSLRKVRPATLRGLFASWAPIGDRIFSSDSIAGPNGATPHGLRIIVVDGPRSVESFALMFKRQLDDWGGKKTME